MGTGKKLPDKIAYKKWELDLARNNSVEAKMKTEKTQLFGVMLGQMSDASMVTLIGKLKKP